MVAISNNPNVQFWVDVVLWRLWSKDKDTVKPGKKELEFKEYYFIGQ